VNHQTNLGSNENPAIEQDRGRNQHLRANRRPDQSSKFFTHALTEKAGEMLADHRIGSIRQPEFL
jgi:hypothetical protein